MYELILFVSYYILIIRKQMW